MTYAYLGQLVDSTGKPLVYASLWELLTGGTTVTNSTSVSGGDKSTVYFTAGLANEAHGLFAGITNSTTTGSTPTFGFSSGLGAATVKAGGGVQVPISVAPVNGFSGMVTLMCNNLPAKTTCVFSPAQLSVSSTAVATGTVSIQTTSSASLRPEYFRGRYDAGIAAAFLVPFTAIFVMRRQLTGGAVSTLRLLSVAIGFFVATVFVIGCSSSSYQNSMQVMTGTPTGQSSITIMATSGGRSRTRLLWLLRYSEALAEACGAALSERYWLSGSARIG